MSRSRNNDTLRIMTNTSEGDSRLTYMDESIVDATKEMKPSKSKARLAEIRAKKQLLSSECQFTSNFSKKFNEYVCL